MTATDNSAKVRRITVAARAARLAAMRRQATEDHLIELARRLPADDQTPGARAIRLAAREAIAKREGRPSELPTLRARCIGPWFREPAAMVPKGTVYVGGAVGGLRSTPYRNPYRWRVYGRAGAVELFRQYLRERPELVAQIRRELTGKTVSCWCPRSELCHADVLIAVADGGEP